MVGLGCSESSVCIEKAATLLKKEQPSKTVALVICSLKLIPFIVLLIKIQQLVHLNYRYKELQKTMSLLSSLLPSSNFASSSWSPMALAALVI